MDINFYRFIIPSGEIYEIALKNNMALMQYEYGDINTAQSVKNNWNAIKQVRENDVILLQKKEEGKKTMRIYAWGYAIKPREHKSKDIKNFNYDDMLDSIFCIDGVKYISCEYNGIIYFNDCECFYDNLTKIITKDEYGDRCWGQRIDIDKWRFNKLGIGVLSNYLDLELSRNTISKIGNKKRASEIIKELTGDDIK